MKRIAPSYKMLNATSATTLDELKLTYRSLIKEWHPDKVINDEAKRDAHEAHSKKIIEAYHFIVSIHKETHASNSDVYNNLINTVNIVDMDYKASNVIITFEDGTVYEYLGVPKNTYVKLVNAPKLARFARRHLFGVYTYRNVSKASLVS
jgi:transcription elongation factor GreA-like protein